MLCHFGINFALLKTFPFVAKCTVLGMHLCRPLFNPSKSIFSMTTRHGNFAAFPLPHEYANAGNTIQAEFGKLKDAVITALQHPNSVKPDFCKLLPDLFHRSLMNNHYQKGDLVWVDLGKPPDEVKGHEQANKRPCVVLSNFGSLKLALVAMFENRTSKFVPQSESLSRI